MGGPGIVEDCMYSRRDLAKIALGALPAARLLAKPNSVYHGVTMGVQSYSLRERSLEDALKALAEIGFSYCELWEGHVAPPGMSRKGLREWRETIAIEQFDVIASQFDRAGVNIYAYNYDFDEDFSDREIERGFEMAKRLGAKVITASSSLAVAKKVNPFAAKAGIIVGIRNQDGSKETGPSNPDELTEVMRGNPNIGISLDIGDYVAAGYDPVQYVTEHNDRLVTLGIQDRKTERGASVVFGQGNTPIAAVLRLLRTRRLRIPAMIEYTYQGRDVMAELERCYSFCRAALR
jgi:sugar phosphate isomerase/epimerase